MTSTPERRLEMREILSHERFTTIPYFMSYFGVSERTILRDLDYLETVLLVPLERKRGNGGGIRVIDGWTANQRYLTPKETELLKELLPGLQPDKQETIKGLLRSLENPLTKQKK